MGDNWSPDEVEAAVADYFDMLEKELKGITYNKAEHNRRLLRIVSHSRGRGSIEYKHRNITAVLIELGFASIPGYKPLFNYQDLLREVVEDQLARAKRLQKIAEKAVEKPAERIPTLRDFSTILVPPPVRRDRSRIPHRRGQTVRRFLPRDYLEIEAHNRSLGRAGEEFVLRFEHEILCRMGKRKLANRIEHVSQTRGDYFGYDILSFERNGREKWIEVKTTQFGSENPFFASRNEVKISESHPNEYQLYRVFQFYKEPHLFVLRGSISGTCSLDPVIFSAIPRSSR